jgi:hypothetical protein
MTRWAASSPAIAPTGKKVMVKVDAIDKEQQPGLGPVEPGDAASRG